MRPIAGRQESQNTEKHEVTYDEGQWVAVAYKERHYVRIVKAKIKSFDYRGGGQYAPTQKASELVDPKYVYLVNFPTRNLMGEKTQLEALISSYTPPPEVRHVGGYKEWLSDELETITGHSVPRCFKSSCTQRQTSPPCSTRTTAPTDNEKTPLEQQQPFSEHPQPNHFSFLTPFPIKRLEEVKDSVERAREMARLTADLHSYWLNFFIRLEEYVPPEEEASPLSVFMPFS
ncbi:hypothetical protein Bbelb_050200 [Branchiostoma belcheri]|nr:hypothetical protein Bbelb_050200 [Branchiostoma belcheri]